MKYPVVISGTVKYFGRIPNELKASPNETATGYPMQPYNY